MRQSHLALLNEDKSDSLKGASTKNPAVQGGTGGVPLKAGGGDAGAYQADVIVRRAG
jgi:hypothetical protein